MAAMATALAPGQVKRLLAAACRRIAEAEAAVARLEPGERQGGAALVVSCPPSEVRDRELVVAEMGCQHGVIDSWSGDRSIGL